MTERQGLLCLNMLSGVGPIKVTRLMEAFGTVTKVFSSSFKDLIGVEGIGPKLASEILAAPHKIDFEGEEKLASDAGVTILTRACSDYPELLTNIPDPPLVLYVRGQVDALKDGNRNVALVGSRRPTEYGIKMAELLSISAVTSDWTTVSGLALGIDTAVHNATVEYGGRTIAVLGSGLGRLYPQENMYLARNIIEKGAVISEFPMTFPPDKRSFPMRNRIISGLTCGTIVVEAGLKSGTLITANQALDQGRQVFAVPGRADQPQSRGCHYLLKQGAKLVENFSDVLEEFNSTSLFDFANQNSTEEERRNVKNKASVLKPVLTLNETEQRIVKFLSQGESTVDAIVEALKLPIGSLFATLIEMETKRLVRPLPGRRYALRG